MYPLMVYTKIMHTKVIHSQQQIARLKAIEYMLLWEGGVNATRLSRLFGVQPKIISKAINEYRKEHPGRLFFDGKDPEKLYIATERFVPTFISYKWSDYTSFMFSNANGHIKETYGGSVFINNVPAIQSPKPEVTRPILKAIRTGKSLQVVYKSRSTPLGSQRLISPHALANDGVRWHCRGYCHLKNRFSDFNLGRLSNVEISEKSNIDSESDIDWHTFVDIEVGANPRLTADQQQLILDGYGHQSSFTLRTRAALVDYLLQYYRIRKDNSEDNSDCDLVVNNSNDIAQYYFSKRNIT